MALRPPTSRTQLLSALLPFIVVGAGALHGALQEQLMAASPEMRKLPLLITSFEFLCCSTLSCLTLKLSGQSPFDAPRRQLLQISVLVLASLVAGNMALRWVSYPCKVVVKSCKLLPTMAVGSMLLQKRFSLHDQAAAILLCLGLVGFSLADAAPSTSGRVSSPLGLGLLLFAVSCDSVSRPPTGLPLGPHRVCS